MKMQRKTFAFTFAPLQNQHFDVETDETQSLKETRDGQTDTTDIRTNQDFSEFLQLQVDAG